MEDPASAQHARAGHHDEGAAPPVQRLRLVDASHQTHPAEGLTALLDGKTVVGRVAHVQLGDVDRHRAVEVDRHLRQLSAVDELVDRVQDRLRSPHGEGGHHQHASPAQGAASDLTQVLLQIGIGMIAVPVRPLHHDPISRGRALRGRDQRSIVAAEVAGEEKPRALPCDRQAGCAQDVSGRLEAARPGPQVHVCVIPDGLQPLRHPLGVILRVERERRPVFGESLPVRVRRVLLLQAPAVGQEDGHKILARGRAVDRSPEPVPNQRRQIAAMVYVSVGQDDRVDLRWLHRKGPPVPLPKLLEPLEEAAVHQHSLLAIAQKKLRACDGSGGAQKGDLHGWLAPSV